MIVECVTLSPIMKFAILKIFKQVYLISDIQILP